MVTGCGGPACCVPMRSLKKSKPDPLLTVTHGKIENGSEVGHRTDAYTLYHVLPGT
jgi:hypothetical protein